MKADRQKDFLAGSDNIYSFANSYRVEQLLKLGQIAEIFLKKVHGNRILDLGCGWANFIKFYVKRYRSPGFKDPIYLGVDSNESYIIENDKWLHEDTNWKSIQKWKFVKSNIESDCFWSLINKNNYDMILASEIIEHLNNRDLFLKRCYDIMGKDSIFIISTPVHRKQNEGVFERNKIFHEFEYYEKDFYDAVQKYFVVCGSFGSLIETNEFKKNLRQEYPDMFKLYNYMRKKLYLPPALLISIFKLLYSSLSGEVENLALVCKRKS